MQAKRANLINKSQVTPSRRRKHIDAMRRLVAKALENGAERQTWARTVWRMEGDCMSPFFTEVEARPSGKETWAEAAKRPAVRPEWQAFGRWTIRHEKRTVVVREGSEIPLILEIWTRCRRCQKCREHRARIWRRRMVAEIEGAHRTWFGTLTLRPEANVQLLSQARSRLAKQGVDLDALDLGEQFREHCRELSKEVTLYIKRLRKQSSVPLRYISVIEQHKSGVPHVHMLVHEPDAPIMHKVLSAQWKLGFTKWKLVEDKRASAYCAKYLAKSAVARVRASVGYGTVDPLQGSRIDELNSGVDKTDPRKGRVDPVLQIRTC